MKKKTRTRILSIVMALTLVVAFSATAFADGPRSAAAQNGQQTESNDRFGGPQGNAPMGGPQGGFGDQQMNGERPEFADGELPELPEGVEAPADGEEPPEKPDGDRAPMAPDGVEPPEKPEDDEDRLPPELEGMEPADGEEPPEKPEGDEDRLPPDGMNGQQPPEKPEGDEDRTPPEFTEGMEAPAEGEEPPEKPEGDEAPEQGMPKMMELFQKFLDWLKGSDED